MKYYLLSVRTAIKKKTNNKHWWECGEKRTLCTVGGNTNSYNHYEKQYGRSSKTKNRTIKWPRNFPPWDLSKEKSVEIVIHIFKYIDLYIFSFQKKKKTKTLIQKGICIHMFNAALFTINNIRKQPKCPW